MYIIKPINDQAIWEKELLASPQANFLHSYYWGEFHENLAHRVFRLGVFEDKKIVGLVLLIKVEAKRGTYFECPGGPILDWDNQELVKTVFDYIRELAKKEKAVFVRIRPNVPVSDQRLTQLKKLNFVKAPMHLHAESTWVVNLSLGLPELMAKMRKNTRYAIRQAEKLGVKVEVSEDLADVQLLYDQQMETAKRHRFVPFSLEYLKAQFEAFASSHKIQLFKATYQGRVLATSFIIFYGPEAVYHYSGSTEEARKIPASYLLQWEVIKAAKEKGFARYNLWGVDTQNRKNHRFAGVTLFKTGFGGESLDYVPAHDLPFSWRYWAIFLFETWRRKLRHL